MRLEDAHTHTTSSSDRNTDYHYYVCKQRKRRKRACGCTQRGVKAIEAESAVWEFVSDLLRDPEHVRRGMERLIEQERLELVRDPELEAEVWAQKKMPSATASAAPTRTSAQQGS